MKYSFKKSVIVLCTLLALTFSALGIQPARADVRLPQGVPPAGLTSADQAQIVALLPAAAITSGDYLKASNTEARDGLGWSIALDGDTLVVGAHQEDSNATGVNGDESDNSAAESGAVYVFTRSGGVWSQQAYLKASNTEAQEQFGWSVAISGETIVVGTSDVGVAYVFTRSGGVWSQQAYLQASNVDVQGDRFGWSVAISGETIVVGAPLEDSNATGVNGDQSDNSAIHAGAAYVFTRSAGVWSQQAYLKASNAEAHDEFGSSVAISGETIVVGTPFEDSKSDGVNGDQSDNFAIQSGAAYVFSRSGGVWSQQAYIKPLNPWINDYAVNDLFGYSVAISGETIVVGAEHEASNATGVNGDGSINSAEGAGAAYVFTRSGGIWSQQAYLKASNTERDDRFGWSVAISEEMIVVGALFEDSNATGMNGDGSDNSAPYSGAAYVFSRSGGMWSQQAYLKASNTGEHDFFGYSVAVSGETIVVGAPSEDSNATGVNGNGSDNSAPDSGAAYTFVGSPVVDSIQRAGASPTASASVEFTVTFSKSVTGVDSSDFALTTTGLSGASITGVSGSGATYTVTVNTGSGGGTIRLDVVDDNSIVDAANNPLGGVNVGDGDFTSGAVYIIDGFNPISKWTSAFDLSHGWTVANYVRTVGDVNNDGMADAVGFGQDGVYVALSNGTSFDAISKWTSSFDLAHGWTVKDYVRTVGDVNNDGRADLIGFGQDGVYVALSNGTSFDAVSKWTSAFDLSHGWTVASYVRTVGDANNDGRADLIGFGHDGVYVALSNGTSFDAVSKWTSAFDLSHGWTVANYVRTVGDVNNDGRADLIGFGLDGVYVALSNGTSFDAVSKWTSAFDLSHGWTVAQYVRTVGDVTGDGKNDLVGFGLDGVYIAPAR